MKQHQNADGTYNGAAVMSELSGIPQDGIRALFKQVQANIAVLDACPQHDFHPVPSLAMRKRYKCSRCCDEVDASAYHWHEQGRRPAP